MRYTAESEKLKITVDSLGAEAVSAVCLGRERLWQNENGSWSGHAPILFPVCGNCGMTVGGKTYPLPKHGFARGKEFTLVNQTASSLEFALCADEESRAVYPFDFVFSVTYTVCENELKIEYTAENPSENEMPFSCGGHESFALPGGLGEYKLAFDRPERLLALVHDDDGLLNGEKLDYGTVKEFVLPADYLQDGRTLIFAGVGFDSLILCSRSGKKEAEIGFGGFPNLLLWRPQGANMVCIEPWLNLPDSAHARGEEFGRKAGVKTVPPHGKIKLTRTVKYF